MLLIELQTLAVEPPSYNLIRRINNQVTTTYGIVAKTTTIDVDFNLSTHDLQVDINFVAAQCCNAVKNTFQTE